MKECVLVLLIIFAFRVNGQDRSAKNFDQDFFLSVDNDAFLVQTVDRYYSSGIYFNYRRLLSPGSVLATLGGKGVTKTIYSIGFAHLFFTPSDLKLRTIDQFDRPYAGIISANFGLKFLKASKSAMTFKLDAGILGPGAGMSEVQRLYHNLIGAKTPRGWQFQIENTPLVSFNFEYVRSIKQKDKFEVFSEGSIVAGTVFNYVKPGVSMRWGNFQSIGNSTYNQSRVGSIGPDTEKALWKESYFFL